MNHRFALKISTNFAIYAFLLTAVGTMLWTLDTMLSWDILPEWLESCAAALVTIVGTLTAFSVVVSLMCSAAVVAENVANRSLGQTETIAGKMSQRTKAIAWALTGVAVLALVVFQQVDVYRAEKARLAAREKHAQNYFKAQDAMRERMPSIVSGFTPAMCADMAQSIPVEGEKSISEMLDAISASTPMAPEVKLMVKTSEPYRYEIAKTRGGAYVKQPSGAYAYLSRDKLVDLPSVWERDTVAAIFEGAELTVPHGRRGAFIDTREPCAWGLVRHEGKVVGIVLLRAPANSAYTLND